MFQHHLPCTATPTGTATRTTHVPPLTTTTTTSGRGRYVDYGLGGYVYDGEFDKGKMSGKGRYAFNKGT